MADLIHTAVVASPRKTTSSWLMQNNTVPTIFLVNRGTRAEEDSERSELARSGVVGRHAPTAATLVVIASALVAIGAACAVSFIVLGYAVAGSIALAGSLVGVGFVFAGITAVAAQVVSSGRAKLGLAAAALADRKSTRLNSSHSSAPRLPSSARKKQK